MRYPEHPDPDRKPVAKAKDRRGSFATRVDRAASELNPFLVMVTIGLMLLDVTLYMGMQASREPVFVRAAQHVVAPVSPGSTPAADLPQATR